MRRACTLRQICIPGAHLVTKRVYNRRKLVGMHCNLCSSSTDRMRIIAIVLVSLGIFSARWGLSEAAIFNVADTGAIGDGKADDSQAFLKAWTSACAAAGDSTIIIPAGKTFLLRPVKFQGLCTARSIHFQVLGNLVAPPDTPAWGSALAWLFFTNVNGLTIDGSGKIDAQGTPWWAKHCKIDPKQECTMAPTAMSFQSVNGLFLSQWNLSNSPRNHININECSNVHISNITISAPKESPNTDGINVGHSQNIEIKHSSIASGDDCISFLSGTSNVNVSDITCGPGHGISVGSLGEHAAFDTVEQIQVQHCTFIGTQNGARIKTWQGGSGYARGITFQNLDLNAVENPIIIDQYYFCDSSCNEASAVQVSDVKLIGIHGTSSQPVAVNLACSKTVGCKDIVLSDVKLNPTNPNIQLSSNCTNVHGPPCPNCLPQVPCLGK